MLIGGSQISELERRQMLEHYHTILNAIQEICPTAHIGRGGCPAPQVFLMLALSAQKR
jgi:hypothetical protein